MSRFGPLILLGIFGFVAVGPLSAQQKAAVLPTAAEVKALLQKEPITEASWPVWKKRLTDWFGDTTRDTDEAYREAERFAARQADSTGRLPARFDQDHLAWYFLGGSYLHKQPSSPENFTQAEAIYRRSVQIQPTFARASQPGFGTGLPGQSRRGQES